MPHINRIRVNNVKYNFGTQFYDDFSMRFDGKNALYDLANGGGKSVLMLLLFQNLIPNCTLDEKQPVEKLFRTSDGSTSIHSLVEWKLDESDIEDGYKYMLTGFCARKAKEDESSETKRGMSAAIDYFNYVIFYRNYNDNDIINLPLSSGNEHMTYTGLRAYLKELSHDDYQLKIAVFDRKGEYQRFISRYGLYESQWEIIRGINKTEGHVRTYFESNYKTTRRVIEDLLIEEVIQKAFVNKAGGDDSDMAETLLEIKDKLLELSKKKDELADYDGQMEALRTFAGRIESLGALYGEEDVYKRELAKVFNTMNLSLRTKQRDYDLAVKEGTLLEKRILETKRRLDTAKVQKNRAILKSMEDDGAADSANLERLEAAYSSKLYELSKAQSMNDYMEYRENEKEIRIIKDAIDNSTKSCSHVAGEMRSLAGEAKPLIAQAEAVLSQKLGAAGKDLQKYMSELQAAGQNIRENERQTAVVDFDIDSTNRRKKQLQKAMADLRGELNVLLAEGTADELKHYEAAYAKAQEALEAAEGEAAESKAALESFTKTLGQAEADEKILEAKKIQTEEFFEIHEKQKAAAEKLFEIYGVSGTEKLKAAIASRYKKAAGDIYIHTEKKEALEAYAANLCENNPSVTSKEVLQVMDYLRRTYHAVCVSGADYLKNIDANDRRGLLMRLPFLPYAVIVSEGFGTLLNDDVFAEKYFADFAIPVISMNTVTDGEGKAVGDGVIFTGGRFKLYTDGTALSSEKLSVAEKISEEEKILRRLSDQQETYLADLEQTHYFMDYFEKSYIERLDELNTIGHDMEELRRKISGFHESIENEKLRIQSAQNAVAVRRSAVEEAAHRRDIAEKMVGLNEDFMSAAARQNENEARRETLLKEHGQLQALSEKLQSDITVLKEQMKGLQTELSGLQKMWTEDFSAYDDGKETEKAVPAPHFDKAQLEAIHVRFMGLKQTGEAGSGELGDKRKLLENCEKTAVRLKAAIAARNISFDTLEALAAGSEICRTDAAALDVLKAEAGRLSDEIKLAQALAADRLANRHRLTGSVENAIQVIEERYGVYKEVDLKDKDYDIFFEEYTKLLSGLKEKDEENKMSRDRTAREIHSLEELKKDVMRLARMAGADMSATTESYMPDMNFKKKAEELQLKYEQLRKTEDFKKAEFEKGRDKLVESLTAHNAAELSAEVRAHIKLPSQLSESSAMLANIEETVRIIMLEKERIATGIDNMVKMKENFVRQCIQRCMDIKTELERLPKMSKITLDNEPIQMLKLKIPYVKEEYYAQRMSDYVDSVAQTADSYKDSSERLKYIRTKLAWKQLFSVIVQDMNSIRLSLYKRERIREQSRFLRYEEAVGSTGQSQGIYIQFLIAVINYISAINSKAADVSALKKVIFIDNPFGAAKDIYIWEPIFELLRENNVQLIVPARGATPAITGKFDVNYILGQKLVGDKQQTVVVDYYSNIEIENVEYRRIEFEQEVFEFV